MASWAKTATLLTLTATLAAPTIASAASRAQFRFLSFTIRDQAPSPDEAKAFRQGDTKLEGFVEQWLQGPGHLDRVRRYFRDMFGVADDNMPLDWAFALEKIGDGEVLGRQRTDKGWCDPATAVDSEAWWLEPGETVKVCPEEVTPSLTFDDGTGRALPCTADKTRWGSCGCGPKLIGCIPRDTAYLLLADIKNEFAQRATLAYERGGSWFDVLASEQFYGTRLLYWKYLQASKMARGGVLPPDAELAQLAAIPNGVWTEAAYPEGSPRAGLVTSPGFLLQYNNYRTRIRALSEKLLCQAIGAPLNTSGIAEYLNPDFKPEDLAHADFETCARCHFPMDNLGSMLFGWNTGGEWDPLGVEMSRIGHAFGQDGEGPRFLMRSFIERGPGFNECMARTAWEDFAGSRWEDLTDTDRQGLISLATKGPRDLIQVMLRSTLLANLGIDSDGTAEPEVVSTVPWTEVQPIIAKNCAGSSCHSLGSFNSTYVDNQKGLLDRANSVATRITSDGAQQMPPLTSGKKLTDAEKAKILGFLGR